MALSEDVKQLNDADLMLLLEAIEVPTDVVCAYDKIGGLGGVLAEILNACEAEALQRGLITDDPNQCFNRSMQLGGDGDVKH